MGSGSPLDARSANGGLVFAVILVVVCCAVLAALIYIFLQKYKSLRQSKKWIEANKNRLTKFSDVKVLSRDAALSDDEKAVLWRLCKRQQAKNICYLYRSEDETTKLFKNEYDFLAHSSPRSEKKLSDLFSLRYKLEKLYDAKHSITSTKFLPVDTEVSITGEKGDQHTFKVKKNIPQGFYVEVPASLGSAKPTPLSKFTLSVYSKAGILHQYLVRAVRYETTPAGKEWLLISHAEALKIAQKRAAKRREIDDECSFSSAKLVKGQKKDSYEVSSKKHIGRMMNISATGCKLVCDLPILEKQYLRIYFSILGLDENEATGIIIKTKRNADEKTFALYIKFTDIDMKVKNDIYAAIYGYI